MNKEQREYLILIAVAVLICILVLLIVILVNNIKLIKEDALLFGMEQHGFSQCSCMDSNFQFVTIDLNNLDDGKGVGDDRAAGGD